MRLTRVLTFPAETERNAALDAAERLDRMVDSGWSEASRVWSRNEMSYSDVALKGFWWASAGAGGNLVCTLVRDPDAVPFAGLRALADREGAMEGVVIVAERLAADRGWPPEYPDATVARLVTLDAVGDPILDALAALPPRVRLEVERALAHELCVAFALR